MNRNIAIALCAAAAVSGTQASAQYVVPENQEKSIQELIAAIMRDSQDAPPALAMGSLDQAVNALRMKMSEAEQELALMRQKVQAGLEPSSKLLGLESRIAALRAQLTHGEHIFATLSRLNALAKKVNVTFDKAPVPNFADLLAKLGGYAISVDKGVPGDLTVTTKADNMPIGTILEFVAQSANLQLGLDDKGAIKIMLPSKMLVGGQSIDLRGKAWPWADGGSIGVNPNLPLGEKWKGLKDLLKGNPIPGLSYEPFKVQVPQPSFSLPSSATLSITPVGSSMVLVSEPGSGKNGEPGYWLTLYTVKNGQLKQTSKLFHSCVRPPAFSIAPSRQTIDLTKWKTEFEKQKQVLKQEKDTIKAEVKKAK